MRGGADIHVKSRECLPISVKETIQRPFMLRIFTPIIQKAVNVASYVSAIEIIFCRVFTILIAILLLCRDRLIFVRGRWCRHSDFPRSRKCYRELLGHQVRSAWHTVLRSGLIVPNSSSVSKYCKGSDLSFHLQRCLLRKCVLRCPAHPVSTILGWIWCQSNVSAPKYWSTSISHGIGSRFP